MALFALGCGVPWCAPLLSLGIGVCAWGFPSLARCAFQWRRLPTLGCLTPRAVLASCSADPFFFCGLIQLSHTLIIGCETWKEKCTRSDGTEKDDHAPEMKPQHWEQGVGYKPNYTVVINRLKGVWKVLMPAILDEEGLQSTGDHEDLLHRTCQEWNDEADALTHEARSHGFSWSS